MQITNLSVIVPCFNAADTIAIQLEALLNQQWHKSWEVIISNNGSTDDTLKIVGQYRERLSNLRVVDASARPGRAHACNVGALAATGEAIAFCDADDEVAPGWVAAMGEALAKYDFVACQREYEKLNESWTLKYRSLSQINGIQEYRYPPYLPHASGSTLGVKRSLHLEIGGFDETMLRLQDTDYCWRIQLTGTKLHFVREAVIHYRFRHTLAGLYRQSRLWGEYNVFLYKKYRAQGMPQTSRKSALIGWLNLLMRFPKVFLSKGKRADWLWKFGWRIGRIQGCIRYRVLAL